MCFAHCNKPSTVDPIYDEEDGSVIEEPPSEQVNVENFHQHIDNVELNFDVNSECSILGFVYQAGNDIIIVYTSDEARDLCNEPFTALSEVVLEIFT